MDQLAFFQNPARRFDGDVLGKPARAFGQPQHAEQKNDGGKHCDGDHPSPRPNIL
jgi:hypothetical protein